MGASFYFYVALASSKSAESSFQAQPIFLQSLTPLLRADRLKYGQADTPGSLPDVDVRQLF